MAGWVTPLVTRQWETFVLGLETELGGVPPSAGPWRQPYTSTPSSQLLDSAAKWGLRVRTLPSVKLYKSHLPPTGGGRPPTQASLSIRAS